MDDGKKAHRVSKSSRNPKKPKHGNRKEETLDPKIRNPKAFAFNSVVKAERKFRRTQDIQTKKERAPQVDRIPVDPPPLVIAIVGPPKVGKSTLFHNLTKHFTRHTLHDVKGPVTIVSGKKRRLTFIECNNDINAMIDTAKVADLVLLLVDASFGFEMEVFEFLNICQVHGFPQIMGVLTHLDLFKNKTQLKKTKKTLKHRFWTEVYPGSKLFYLSGYHPLTNSYPKKEIQNLARFISVMKFRQTSWRSEHSYVIVDRLEDLTPAEDIRLNSKVGRNICMYGYVHGTFLKPEMSVHIPGLGDYTPEALNVLDDPCPLPMKERTLRRSLNEKEKVIYAPFSGVGGIVYDQDAVYIDLAGSHSHKRTAEDHDVKLQEPGSEFVTEILDLKTSLDEKMEHSALQLFSASNLFTSVDVGCNENYEGANNSDDEEVNDKSSEFQSPETDIENSKNVEIFESSDGRRRRKVIFDVNNSAKHETKDIKTFGGNDDGVRSNNDNQATESNWPLHPSTVPYHEERVMGSLEDASSLASKIKARLGNSTKNSVNPTTSKSNPGSTKEEGGSGSQDVEPEMDEDDESEMDDDDESEMDEDGESEIDKDGKLEMAEEDESDTDQEDEDRAIKKTRQGNRSMSEENCDDVEKKFDFGEGPEVIELMKRKRYDDAESGFYSRLYKRSLQRMIYESSAEYVNVGPKADFDLANCTVPEATGKYDDSNAVMDGKIKNLFIGGEYAETAKALLEENDESDSAGSLNGDFEELDKDNDDDGDIVGNTSSENKTEESEAKKRQEMKKKLKENFDMQYDEGGDGKENSFYTEWKEEVEEQTKVNREFFKDVKDSSLLEDLQGCAPGSYVRILILGLPHEFFTNFDPQAACPLIVGSLDSPNQETQAVIQARVKKHRWHSKILKTGDAVILSVGWRRFQTVALYSIHDHNMRNRLIKYTPEHLHCVANFYGPIAPQGTGILGISPEGFEGFRITLTGTILDMDKSTELVKKLKLIGYPEKVFKKSAFIQGMFNSQLEVAKFVGAKIKTVSGVRGVIKKQLRTPPGAFRATFEDGILLSDVVFCRTWTRVEVPKFYLSIPNHVVAKPRLVKTLGQLKRESQVKETPDPDHLYRPVKRTVKRFKPLQIPKRLQERLPYSDKPKVKADITHLQRIAVIKDQHETKMTDMLKAMKSSLKEKEVKLKAQRAKNAAKMEKRTKKLEEKQSHRQKALRKKIFRTLGKTKQFD